MSAYICLKKVLERIEQAGLKEELDDLRTSDKQKPFPLEWENMGGRITENFSEKAMSAPEENSDQTE